MKINETREFMERVKVHYPTFIIDTYTIEEWHSQLKEYSYEDINKRFNEHLQSEQYGEYIPKIWFLTKNLIKEDDKERATSDKVKFTCNICGEEVTLINWNSHYDRCIVEEYIIKQAKKYRNKDIDRSEIKALSQEKLDALYEKMINIVYEQGNESDRYYIDGYRKCKQQEFLD